MAKRKTKPAATASATATAIATTNEKQIEALRIGLGLQSLTVVKESDCWKVSAIRYVAGQTRALGFKVPLAESFDEVCRLINLNFE